MTRCFFFCRKPITTPLAALLLSHLCASPKSLPGPVPVCLQAGHGCGDGVTLTLASPAGGAHLHVQSLCLRCDTDNKDGEVVGWGGGWISSAHRLCAGAEQREPGAGGVSLRSEFIKDSSNMDELRVSSLLLKPVFSCQMALQVHTDATEPQ